jgi:hypothetical protein
MVIIVSSNCVYYNEMYGHILQHGFFSVFFHHNIVYSKSPVYNNLNGPGVNIKGPYFTVVDVYKEEQGS